MLPFVIPKLAYWMAEQYINPQSIFNRWTYRSILNVFFDKHTTRYNMFEYKRIAYVNNTIGTSLSCISRTTYLLSLTELITTDNRMKCIFKLFLQYADNINFYHPTNEVNTLVHLKRILIGNAHSDVMDLLLQRKEIQEPSVIFYLSTGICKDKQISLVLDMFVNRNLIINCDLVSRMLQNYIQYNYKYSKVIIKRLLDKSNGNFNEMFSLFLSPKDGHLLHLVPLVNWQDLKGFDTTTFNRHINMLFTDENLFQYQAHSLLEIYMNIVKQNKLHVEIFIPPSIIKRIISKQYTPEQLILLECTFNLENYKHLLPQDCPIVKYIRNRFKRRYQKFILF